MFGPQSEQIKSCQSEYLPKKPGHVLATNYDILLCLEI